MIREEGEWNKKSNLFGDRLEVDHLTQEFGLIWSIAVNSGKV